MGDGWWKTLGMLAFLAPCLTFTGPGTPLAAQGGGEDGDGHRLQGGGDHGTQGGGGGHRHRHRHRMRGGGHGEREPGSLRQKCPSIGEAGPPIYCEPAYRVASSVKGVRISGVDLAGEREVRVTLRELDGDRPGVKGSVFVFAGAGGLAGGSVLEGGWQEIQQVRVSLDGPGSLYQYRLLRVHVFPVTME